MTQQTASCSRTVGRTAALRRSRRADYEEIACGTAVSPAWRSRLFHFGNGARGLSPSGRRGSCCFATRRSQTIARRYCGASCTAKVDDKLRSVGLGGRLWVVTRGNLVGGALRCVDVSTATRNVVTRRDMYHRYPSRAGAFGVRVSTRSSSYSRGRRKRDRHMTRHSMRRCDFATVRFTFV
jgi:hypothetical protein